MIRIKMSNDGQYYFVVIAKNGKVVATSETYTQKKNCIRGAMALCTIASSGIVLQDETGE